jgi:hypothetical protein
LGIRAIAESTVKNILKEHGLDPDPKRGEWTAERARESLCFLAVYADHRPIPLGNHDTKFGDHFDAVLGESGVRVQKVGPRAPNLNAVAERWVQTVQREGLHHFIVFREAHLRYLLAEMVAHCHLERPL